MAAGTDASGGGLAGSNGAAATAKGSDSASSSRLQAMTRSFHGAVIALVLSLAVFRFFIQDADDRHHCKALLNEGRWLDSKHTSWQPEGCMLHPYKPKEVRTCLEGRSVVFIGDSTVRQVFYATVKHVDKNVDTKAEKHADRALTAGGIHFSFFWDPFLNGTRADQLLAGTLGASTAQGKPTLAVVGSGVWYLRHRSSGGIDAWSTRMDDLFAASNPNRESIADEVILLPVVDAIESRLSPERAATIKLDDINKMNQRLDEKLEEARFEPGTGTGGLAVARSFNEVIEGLDEETVDGLHFSDTISKVQASILLNLRCNDVLPKHFPFDKTCCFEYPAPNWVQIALLVFLIGFAPLGLYLYSHGNINPVVFRFFPDQKYLLPLAVFGFSTALLFVADRTNLFLKENKQYDAITFGILCLLTLVAGVVTMKPPEKDLGFLNRDQTDEWKGWMQIAILIYHYLGASKISGIYNPIRVLVAAYLFMSGYGHLSFFLKKADFGFARVANILVRLNLLTVVLAYLMNTDYLSYYFSPLVTIWFGIIWVTLWIGHKYNDKPAFLLIKLCTAAALTAVFFEMKGPLEATFDFINSVFGTSWNATEWRFRQTLDMWIVWVGMLTAYAFIKIKEYRITDDLRWPQWQRWTIIASAVAMAGYFVFELTRESKFVYNRYHPYVSIVPVLAWCVLRNATPFLRSTSSKFFIFFGQCSLETFILQFHLFIAGDTRGIIMMIPGGPLLRPVNFIITSIVFVYISNQVAIATGILTAMICYVPKPASGPARLPTASRDAIPAEPASASAASGHPASAEYVALSTPRLAPRTMHSACSRLAASARTSLRAASRTTGPRLAQRPISSTVRREEAKSTSLLLDQAGPETEGEAVNRIDALLKLTDRLSRQSKNAALPLNLRAQGLYEKDGPTQPVVVEGEELVPLPQTRRMGDSFVQLDLPFSKDASLREQYVGGISKVRMGRLMEDFDSLAGAAAYRYVLPDGVDIAAAHKYGFYLVTAAVDRMDLLRPLHNADGSIPDIRLSGHVSYTTSSSLEVFLRMATIPSSPSEESSTILIGRFAMACRSAKGGKHRVPELLVDGPEEQAMWSMGRDMREGKKKRSSASLTKTPPTEEEAAMLHELFLQKPELYDRKASTPSNIIFMSDTRITSANLMHPAERNVHNKIFGGFLMRLAYETAYSTACLFSRSPVTFVSLDELQFAQPVEIGSLLLLDSKVTFSPMQGEHHSFHVSVEAATCDLYTGEKKITNTFHYTFSSERPLSRHVVPRTYRQAMQWLDAQRRRRIGIEVRQAYTKAL